MFITVVFFIPCLGLSIYYLLLETMCHFAQKFWRGWSKN